MARRAMGREWAVRVASKDSPIGLASVPFAEPDGSSADPAIDGACGGAVAYRGAARPPSGPPPDLAEAARSETLRRVAAGVVHEIKNPLGVLALGLAFLREHPLAVEPELVDVLADMADAVTRANAAMAGLLELATPRKSMASRRPLEGPVGRAVALARTQSCCAGVALVEERSSGPTDVVVDAALASQVLVNVLLDVVEATPLGGTVRVRTFALAPRPPGARGATEPRRGWVACEVESLVSPDAVRAPDGAGETRPLDPRVGLAGARRLLAEQGGWLRVTRAHGGGARVTVAYPAAE